MTKLPENWDEIRAITVGEFMAHERTEIVRFGYPLVRWNVDGTITISHHGRVTKTTLAWINEVCRQAGNTTLFSIRNSKLFYGDVQLSAVNQVTFKPVTPESNEEERNDHAPRP